MNAPAPPPTKSRTRQGTLVRVLERRFGLALRPSLHSLVLGAAEELVREKVVANLSEVIAKLTVAGDDDGVVRRMQRAASIGETYFLRAPEQLQALLGEVATLVNTSTFGPPRPLRVWSAACASGQEVYTLAALFQSRFPAHPLQVLGTDMNREALAVAKRGRYDALSFRGGVPRALSGVFEFQDGQWTVNESVRRCVSFSELNLATAPDAAWRALGKFDVVVCRNVLMYLDPEKVPEVMARLASVCLARSVVALTPSEFQAATYLSDFQQLPQALLVRQPSRAAAGRDLDVASSSRSGPPPPPKPLPPVPVSRPPLTPTARRVEPERLTVGDPSAGVAPVLGDEERLARARAAADRGELAEAHRELAALLAERPETCRGYQLLGELCSAEGRWDEAVVAFEKALYFERELLGAELGLARALGQQALHAQARPHLQRALRLLGTRSDDELVEGVELTVGALRRLIQSGMEEAGE